MKRLVLLALALGLATPAVAADSLDGVMVADTGKKKTTKKKAAKKPAKRKPAKKKRAPKRMLPDWTIGLTGGFNINSIGGEDTDELETIGGFNVQLDVIYDFTSWAGFETGLGYTTRGSQYQTDDPHPMGGGPYTHSTTTYSASYVELPLMLRLGFKTWKLKPFFHGGVYLGFLTGSEIEREVECVIGECNAMDNFLEGDKRTTTNADPKGANGFDFGFKLGIGTEFELHRTTSVVAQFDYARGLTDFFDAKEAGAAEDLEQVHVAYLVTLGALFRF